MGDNMNDSINELVIRNWLNKSLKVMIAIVISFLLYSIVSKLINSKFKNNTFEKLADKKAATYIKLFSSINRYIFITLTIFVILQILEINITSVIAGVGLLGAIFGLAIQDWLKDIIRGSTILSDNYFHVGDIVKYKDIEGKVLVLGLKTTRIKDLKTQNTVSIANRNIDEIEVLSNYSYINISLPYELKLNKAEKIIDEIVNNSLLLENVDACTYKGISDFADSSIKYLLEIKCNPLNKRQTIRNVNKEILLVLEKNKVSIPYTQIDVHNK